MPKRSDIEQQIAALQAQLDGADTDDEVWIKDGDREIKVSGKRATTILGRFADLWESEGAEEDSEEEETPGDEKPKRDSFFKGKAK
jgi:hypothetical protein